MTTVDRFTIRAPRLPFVIGGGVCGVAALVLAGLLSTRDPAVVAHVARLRPLLWVALTLCAAKAAECGWRLLVPGLVLAADDEGLRLGRHVGRSLRIGWSDVRSATPVVLGVSYEPRQSPYECAGVEVAVAEHVALPWAANSFVRHTGVGRFAIERAWLGDASPESVAAVIDRSLSGPRRTRPG